MLYAFNELYEEANRLTFSNNRFESENKWLKSKLTQLQGENNNLKTNMNALEMVYQFFSCECASTYLQVVKIAQVKKIKLSFENT